MSISASNGWVALVMSVSSAVLNEKAGRNATRPHFSGCGLLENVAELVNQRCRRTRRDPSSSIEQTTESCAELSPGECHDGGHTAERLTMSRTHACVRPSEAGDAAVQIV